MSQARSNSISSGVPLTELDMSDIIKSLTNNLASIEHEMVVAWRAGKSKLQNSLSKEYLNYINDLVTRMRNIASSLFNETEISKVKPYKSTDEIPENYDKYLRVSENIANLVSQDILYQPDVDHAVAVFDRWLYICKIAFHKNDFFTASCIINGLTSLSVITSKIESELCQSSLNLYKYYRLLLEKSSSLYHKQTALIADKLEVIPVLHALTSLYVQLGDKPNKKNKPSIHQLEEIAVKRRAVSRNFAFIQKKSKPELDATDAGILSNLYRRFDEKFTSIKTIIGEAEQVNNFHLRSKTLKALVENMHDITSTPRTRKKTGIEYQFSVAHFSNLADERMQLITIWASIEELEQKYQRSPTEMILYNVKSILSKVDITDKAMRHQINDQFDLSKAKLDKKILKLHKKINHLLITLIMNEMEYGIKFKGDELKFTASSEETKGHFAVKKSPKEETKNESKQWIERSDSQSEIRLNSTPQILSKHIRMESELSEAESESSLSLTLESEIITATQSYLQIPQLPDVATSAAVSERESPKSFPSSVTETNVPDISSSIAILSTLRDKGTPRISNSAPASVRTEIEELHSAKSVRQAKSAYEQSVVQGGGSLAHAEYIVASPRLERKRSGSVSFFMATKAINNQSSGGSLSARTDLPKKPTF